MSQYNTRGISRWQDDDATEVFSPQPIAEPDLLSKAVMFLATLFVAWCACYGLVLTVWKIVDWMRGTA